MRYMQHAAQLLLMAALVGCDGDRVTGPGPASDAQPSTQVVPAGPTATLAGGIIEDGVRPAPGPRFSRVSTATTTTTG